MLWLFPQICQWKNCSHFGGIDSSRMFRLERDMRAVLLFFEGKQGFKCVFPSRAWEQGKCKIREMFQYEIKGLTVSNISKQRRENNDHNRCPNCINRNIIGLPFFKR